ncbi:MAG: hypothetical protein H0U77_10430 [Nocardioidaceae bacterium]|nr:hypothetical protein [Nocardioidaceae bacterium]
MSAPLLELDPAADPIAALPALPLLSAVLDGDLHDRLPSGLCGLAQRFLQAVVEIVDADRPVTQLVRWATPEVYAEVQRRADDILASTDASVRAHTDRARVVSVHLCRPRVDVAEVSGHVRHAGRSRALAARLERRRDRWVCTALLLG